MKLTYQKPALVRRGNLVQIAAQLPPGNGNGLVVASPTDLDI
jgi:hypothetical protein